MATAKRYNRDKLGIELIEALDGGKFTTARALLRRGASVVAHNQNGTTALMYAAGAGKVEIVKELLAKGADPKKTNRFGHDALRWAEDKEGKNFKTIIEILQGPGS